MSASSMPSGGHVLGGPDHLAKRPHLADRIDAALLLLLAIAFLWRLTAYAADPAGFVLDRRDAFLFGGGAGLLAFRLARGFPTLALLASGNPML
jgi:hypothetical protein